LRARVKFRVDLAHSFMVGGRWRDIKAGRQAGRRTILVGYGETFPSAPTGKIASLPAPASLIIRRSGIDGEIT